MKLSELKPCACCGGPLIPPGSAIANWYVIRQTMAMIKPETAKQVLGLAAACGDALLIAEVLAPDSNAVTILGDENADLMAEIHVCFECYVSKFGKLYSVLGEQ